MTSKWMHNLKKVLIQILPVMFGVYLGLVGNNWNENRKNIKLEGEVISKLITEIQDNKAQIASVIDYHKMLADSSEAFFQNWDPETYMQPAFQSPETSSIWRGTRTGKLKTAAFEAAIVSGVFANLDVDLLTRFSEINRTQLSYEQMSAIYLQRVIELSPEQPVITYATVINSFANDTYLAEKQLLGLYNEMLDVLGNK